MKTVNKNYDLALLAEICYIDHTLDKNDPSYNKKLGNLLTKKDLSETQAQYFIDNFEIVHQQGSTDTSGYSGTLFKRKNPKEGESEYIFSNRGTEFFSKDLTTDVGDLFFNGLGWEQIVEMYNYWQKLITPEGKPCLQAYYDKEARIRNGATAHNDDVKIYFLNTSINPNVVGLGKIEGNPKIDVSGHSLGGHLATAFSRLFPDRIDEVLTINGAGYSFFGNGLPNNVKELKGEALESYLEASFAQADRNAAKNGILFNSRAYYMGIYGKDFKFSDLFTGNTDRLFEKLGGANHFDKEKITNLYGDKGSQFTTSNDGSMTQPGLHKGIYIEDDGWWSGNQGGHKAKQMVDSIAVYDLLLNLDSNKNTHGMDKNTAKDLLEMFKSTSITRENTLEKVVQHLYKMMTGGKTISIKMDDRESLYSAIKQVQDSPVYQNSIGKLTFSSIVDHHVEVFNESAAAAIKAKIKMYISPKSKLNLAYRYALVNGLPFVLEGFDYSMLNQKGELNFYNAKLSCKKGSLGQLTEEYIEARLNYLVTMLENNITDSTFHLIPDEELFRNSFRDEYGTTYFDRSLSRSETIIFKSNARDIIKVEGNNGKVFAGGGEDHITISGEGNYIEGGMDLDTYNVISGHHHVINDVDGLGEILSNGLNLHSDEAKYNPPSVYYNGSYWRDNKGRIFAKTQYDLLVSDPEQGISFTVKDYFLKFKPKNGFVSGLGIKLEIPKMAERLFEDCECDPLVLDLNGNGYIDTIKNNRYKGAMFDYEGDGIRKSTNWLDKGDGFVFVDVNGDGIVNNGTELLSEFYRKRDGSLAKHGMEALADLDTNGDGKVDNQDQLYSKIKVWMDLNGDGISSENEIFTLESLGIAALNTGYKEVNQSLGWGDKIRQTGSFVKSDGSTGLMADINFKVNPFYSEFTDEVELTEEQEGLINLGGIRNLRSLQEAASLSPKLEEILKQYGASSAIEQRHLMFDLLLEWAKTDPEALKYYEENHHKNSKSNYNTYSKITILKAFQGISDKKVKQCIENYANIRFNYARIVDDLYYKLLPQTDFLAPYLEEVVTSVNKENGEFIYDLSKPLEIFKELLAKDVKKGMRDLSYFITYSPRNYHTNTPQTGSLGQFKDLLKEYLNDYEMNPNDVVNLGRNFWSNLGNDHRYWLGNTTLGDNLNDAGFTLSGSKKDQQIIAGVHEDHFVFKSSISSSTYMFAKGHGKDSILDCDYKNTEGKEDTIRLFDVKFSEAKFKITKNGPWANDLKSLIIYGYHQNDEIFIKDYFDSSGKYKIEFIEFEDRRIAIDDWVLSNTYLFDQKMNLTSYEKDGAFEIDSWYIFGTYNATLKDFDGVNDTIIFEGWNSSDFIFSRSQYSSYLLAQRGSFKLSIKDYFDPSGKHRIEKFVFEDKTITEENFLELFDTTYRFEKGFGEKFINDSEGNDTIIFKGIKSTDMIFDREGYSLKIKSLSGEDALDIYSFFESSGNYQIEQIVFEDKTLDLTKESTMKHLFDTTYYVEKNKEYLSKPLIIDDGQGTNTIVFKGIKEEEIEKVRDQNDLVIKNKNGDNLVVISHYYDESGKYLIKDFVFEASEVNTPNPIIPSANDNSYIIDKKEKFEGVLCDQYGNDTLTFKGFKANEIYFEKKGNDLLAHYKTHVIKIEKFFDPSKNYIIETFIFDDQTIVITEDSWSVNQSIIGTINSETYRFQKGHGRAVINDFKHIANEVNMIEFTDVKSDEVKYRREGFHLIIYGYNALDQVKIENFFYFQEGISEIKFSDKTVSYQEFFEKGIPLEINDSTWGWSGVNIFNINAYDKYIYGNNANDVIHLNSGAGNRIFTGAGDDLIFFNGSISNYVEGGLGSDTYVFSKGHRYSTIFDYRYTERDVNIIEFTDVNFGEVQFRKEGFNLIIYGYNNFDEVTVNGFFLYHRGIDQIKFADQTVSYTDFLEKGITLEVNDFNGVFTGWTGVNKLNVSSENSFIYGNNANDVIYLKGASGNRVYGGAGDDRIISTNSYQLSHGNYLEGGLGSDTYVFSEGSWGNTIFDYRYTPNDVNVVEFTDIKLAEAFFRKEGFDLIVDNYHPADQLRITGFFYYNRGIDHFNFLDQTLDYDTLVNAFKEGNDTVSFKSEPANIKGYEARSVQQEVNLLINTMSTFGVSETQVGLNDFNHQPLFTVTTTH